MPSNVARAIIIKHYTTRTQQQLINHHKMKFLYNIVVSDTAAVEEHNVQSNNITRGASTVAAA